MAKVEDGYDLTRFSKLHFAARASTALRLKFFVGGIAGVYRDSITLPIERIETLSETWSEYTIDLSQANLSHVIGGFGFAIKWSDNNIQGLPDETYSVFLDEIRFERE